MSRAAPRPSRRAARRGVAMVLVMIAVTIALVLATSFLAMQSTVAGTAETVERRAEARAAAESGLAIAVSYIETNRGWRSGVAQGIWIDDEPLADARFTVRGEDGRDEDGDGFVDGDGDVADDPEDPVTLTSVGRAGGVTHRVQAVVTPVPTRPRVLMVVPNRSRLNLNDRRRLTQFEAWGFDVALLDARAAPEAYADAVAAADAAYVPESVYSGDVGRKLRDAPIGVVLEENFLNDEMGIARSGGSSYRADRIEIVADDHFITEPFATGSLRLTRRRGRLRYVAGVPAPDAEILAVRERRATPVLAVVDVGGTLADAGVAAGRRVALPVGGTNFDWPSLSKDGLTLIERALRWAATPLDTDLAGWWPLDEDEGLTAFDATNRRDGRYRRGVRVGLTSPFFLEPFIGLDGRNDHVVIPHGDAHLVDEGTLAFWFQTSRRGSRQGLVSKDARGNGSGGHLAAYLNSGRVTVRLEAERGVVTIASPPIEADVWYHVAVAFGADGLRLYLDGALVASDPYAGGLGRSSGGSGNREPIVLGALTWRSYPSVGWPRESYLSGHLRDVRLYGTSLFEAQIADLAAAPEYVVRWTEEP